MPVFQATITTIPTDPVTLTLSGNYTVVSNNYTLLCDASGGSFSVFLPPANTYQGKTVNFKKIDSSANTISVVADGTELILNTTWFDTLLITSEGTAFSLQAKDGNWYLF